MKKIIKDMLENEEIDNLNPFSLITYPDNQIKKEKIQIKDLIKLFNEVKINVKKYFIQDRIHFCCKSIFDFLCDKGYAKVEQYTDDLIACNFIPNNIDVLLLHKYFNIQSFKTVETEDFYSSENGEINYKSHELYILFLRIYKLLFCGFISYEKSDYKDFIDSIEKLIYSVLQYGFPTTIRDLLKGDKNSSIRDQYISASEICKCIISFGFIFGEYEDALNRYNGYTSKYNLQMGSYLDEFCQIPQMNYERYVIFLFYGFKKLNNLNISKEKLYERFKREFYDKISNENVIFLWQIHNMLKNKYSDINYSKIEECVFILKDIVNWLETNININQLENYKNITPFLEINDIVKNPKIRRFLDKELENFLINNIKSYVETGNFIFEEDENVIIIKKIINDIKFLKDNFSLIKSLGYSLSTESYNSFLKHMNLFFDIYYPILSYENHYDIQSNIVKPKDVEDMINKTLLDIKEKEFKLEMKMFNELQEGEEEKYTKHFLDFLGNYVEGIEPLTINDIDRICSDYNYTNHPFNYNIDDYYKFIMKNEKIVYELAKSQKLLEKSVYMECKGDYTNYIVGQVKIIERLLKEILVQRFRTEIYDSNQNEFTNKIIFGENIFLNADNLSNKELGASFELGKISYAMTHVYMLNGNHEIRNSNYNGIFSYNRSNNSNKRNNQVKKHHCQKSPFYKHFIGKIRNGYFHIHQIKTYSEALKKSRLTAYWMCRIIDEILTYDELNRNPSSIPFALQEDLYE